MINSRTCPSERVAARSLRSWRRCSSPATPWICARRFGAHDKRGCRPRFRSPAPRHAAGSCPRTTLSPRAHPDVGGRGEIGDHRREIHRAHFDRRRNLAGVGASCGDVARRRRRRVRTRGQKTLRAADAGRDQRGDDEGDRVLARGSSRPPPSAPFPPGRKPCPPSRLAPFRTVSPRRRSAAPRRAAGTSVIRPSPP